MAETLGIVGLGLLGSALAERLAAAGFDLLGFDADAERLRASCTPLGVRPATSAPAVLAACRRTVLCLPDSRVVRQVVQQSDAALVAGSVLIDTTTGAPDDTQWLADRLAERGITYLDATIVGSSAQVREAQAMVLVGGSAAVVEQNSDVLDAIAARRFRVGPSGSAARMKLVVNLVLGLHRAVLAEGLTLAGAAGLDPALALEILRHGPASSAVMDTKGEKMLRQDFSPQARLAQHLKDVELILSLASQTGAATPLSSVHRELLRRAVELGYAEADNCAVIKAYAERASRAARLPFDDSET